MDNKELVIAVTPRTIRGKQNKQLRKSKQIPAIVYGPKQKNLTFTLNQKLADKFYKKEYDNKIFTLQSEDKNLNGLKVIRKDISIHKIKRNPIHMDFLSLDMNAPIRINVEVIFKGVPKGVKEEGGVFNIILRNVEIECLPDKIPPSLPLDVSSLGLNENFHVSDLKISEDLKLITKPTRTLCTVVSIEEEIITTTPTEVAEEATATTEAATPTEQEATATPTNKKDNDSSKK